MKSEEYEYLEKQHINNYISAVNEIISNNTNALFDDDIKSLISKPPLDSMDVIKNKYLELAKKYKVTLNTKQTDSIIEEFRLSLIKKIDLLKNIRKETLSSEISDFLPERDIEIIKISKKELNDINKKIYKEIKKIIKDLVAKYLTDDISKFYVALDNEIQKEKLQKEVDKFFGKIYQKQILEGIEFKTLVKDTTLINGVREQGERYIFTKTNSRINELG